MSQAATKGGTITLPRQNWPGARVPLVAQVARAGLKKKIRGHLAWPVLGIDQMCISVNIVEVNKKMLHMQLVLVYSTTRHSIPSDYLQPAGRHKRDPWSFWANECAISLCPLHQWHSQFGSYSAHLTTHRFDYHFSFWASERHQLPSE